MRTRRELLLSAAALSMTACGPKLAKRFNGYAFVANAGGHTVAAVNLSRFKVEKEIPLSGAPAVVIAVPGSPRALAFSPADATVSEIDANSLAVSRRARYGGTGKAIQLSSDGSTLWMLAAEPKTLTPLDMKSFRPKPPIHLPAEAADFDLDDAGKRAVVTFPALKRASILDLTTGKTLWNIELNGEPGVARFRPDGKQVLIGIPTARAITVADAASGRAMVTLPLALAPERFYFGAGGGQMFVSGRGMDAIAIVFPYQTVVSETILAGRAPGAMTVSDTQVYVANPESGDVTVISIADRRVMAKIPVGEEPVAIALADEYMLAVNKKSCDLAVVRVSKMNDFRYKRAGLFTVVPVGEKPVSAAVCRL